MSVFKLNRWMVPLFGVILVCFSAIILLVPGLGLSGERDEVHLGRLQSPRLSSAAESGDIAMNTANRTKPAAESGLTSRTANVRQVQPKLSAVYRSPRYAWKPMLAAEWLSAKAWHRTVQAASPAAARGGTFAATAVSIPQSVREARRKAAIGVRAGQSAVKKAAASKLHPPAILYFSRNRLLSREERHQATRSYAVSVEDVLLLERIVMAEAEGEPYEGKVAVANVVLNRLRSANFPDTIKEVIYQKYQFSPVANGRLNRVKPNRESVRAVADALSGVKAVTDDTYYFLSLKLAQDLSVHHSQTFSKKIGNHSFYR
ncbi:cell wall hydrolase [Paenibacillus apii]|nr:cell wall hydrolase [Paenibacillus apii]